MKLREYESKVVTVTDASRPDGKAYTWTLESKGSPVFVCNKRFPNQHAAFRNLGRVMKEVGPELQGVQLESLLAARSVHRIDG